MPERCFRVLARRSHALNGRVCWSTAVRWRRELSTMGSRSSTTTLRRMLGALRQDGPGLRGPEREASPLVSPGFPGPAGG